MKARRDSSRLFLLYSAVLYRKKASISTSAGEKSGRKRKTENHAHTIGTLDQMTDMVLLAFLRKEDAKASWSILPPRLAENIVRIAKAS